MKHPARSDFDTAVTEAGVNVTFEAMNSLYSFYRLAESEDVARDLIRTDFAALFERPAVAFTAVMYLEQARAVNHMTRGRAILTQRPTHSRTTTVLVA